MKKIICSAAIFFCLVPHLFAESNTWALYKSSSTVDFSVKSTAIETSGTFLEYQGKINLKGRDLSQSQVFLNANSSKVRLAQLPIDQMLLVSTLIQSNPSPQVSFTSTKLKNIGGDRYLLSGIASTGRKQESVKDIPIMLVRNSLSSILLSGAYNRSGLIGSSNNPQSQMFGEVDAKVNFKLEFRG